jgi:hypothetical protein
MSQRLSIVVAAAAVTMLLAAEPAHAATRVRVYSPIDDDGTLRNGLSVFHVTGEAECNRCSFIAADAYRCFNGHLIRDPCYLDTRLEEEDTVLCARSPWAHTVTSLPLSGSLPDPSGTITQLRGHQHDNRRLALAVARNHRDREAQQLSAM